MPSDQHPDHGQCHRQKFRLCILFHDNGVELKNMDYRFIKFTSFWDKIQCICVLHLLSVTRMQYIKSLIINKFIGVFQSMRINYQPENEIADVA